jgi:hypothetical protein
MKKIKKKKRTKLTLNEASQLLFDIIHSRYNVTKEELTEKGRKPGLVPEFRRIMIVILREYDAEFSTTAIGKMFSNSTKSAHSNVSCQHKKHYNYINSNYKEMFETIKTEFVLATQVDYIPIRIKELERQRQEIGRAIRLLKSQYKIKSPTLKACA